ncbi:Sesquiterpene synthase [Thalictrum thalictroides]|uniref:Sesquiterpene synthase n=1 Tax=Thalictrum thalictroides TaxID=46969 RepID=A0A7J6V259_THATH|nr:Sesquiterpene synthase [Thalictrum thalictroides]
MQDHNKNLLEEAKVIFSDDLPTLEKWLSLSVPSVSCSLFIIIATLNLGEIATKEVFDWIASMPKIINYTNLLVRLLGDIASLKVEQARGTNASCVPCYMMDEGVSESEAIESLEKVITSLWKVMNQEGLRAHPVPMRVIKIILNFNRTIALYYAGVGVDGHSISDGRTKQIITSIFIDPIST